MFISFPFNSLSSILHYINCIAVISIFTIILMIFSDILMESHVAIQIKCIHKQTMMIGFNKRMNTYLLISAIIQFFCFDCNINIFPYCFSYLIPSWIRNHSPALVCFFIICKLLWCLRRVPFEFSSMFSHSLTANEGYKTQSIMLFKLCKWQKKNSNAFPMWTRHTNKNLQFYRFWLYFRHFFNIVM